MQPQVVIRGSGPRQQRQKETVTALQRFLRGKGLYRGLVDGVRGPLTVKAEQEYLNDQRKFQ